MQATITTTVQRNLNKVTKHMGRYVKRRLRDWSELGFYDKTKMLDSELDTAILATATEKINESDLFKWPENCEIKQADRKRPSVCGCTV